MPLETRTLAGIIKNWVAGLLAGLSELFPERKRCTLFHKVHVTSSTLYPMLKKTPCPMCASGGIGVIAGTSSWETEIALA